MKFLPSINGSSFIIVYGIYSIVLLIIYHIVCKDKDEDEDDFIVSSISEEEYFILNNSYNVNKIFYYITYRLYAKNIIINTSGHKFKAESNSKIFSADLNLIEREVVKVYNQEFEPKKFKKSMIDENIFKKYYYSIKEKLIQDKLLKNEIKTIKKKIVNIIVSLIILIPGLLRLWGGIINLKPVAFLVLEIIIISMFMYADMAGKNRSRISKKGLASMKLFKDTYSLNISDYEKYHTDNPEYMRVMEGFLIGSLWQNILGVNDVNSGASSSGSSCSSCTSCNSCSSCTSCNSCSSCSSCSGCGGCGSD